MIKLKNLFRSFKHAMRGVRVVFLTEQSFRIQMIVGLLVIFVAILLRVSTFELITLLLLIGSVLVLELINSIFERIVDVFKPRIHPIVRDIKDIMAGTVLIVSIVSFLVGLVIFLPRLAILVYLLG